MLSSLEDTSVRRCPFSHVRSLVTAYGWDDHIRQRGFASMRVRSGARIEGRSDGQCSQHDPLLLAAVGYRVARARAGPRVAGA